MTFDPLLNCLVFLTRFYKRPYSAEALQAGLPKSADKFTHAFFIRAAERVGLTSRLVKRPLNKLSTFLLPAVVFLKDESCCVLLENAEKGQLKIMMPDVLEGVKDVSVEDFEQQYAGFALLVHPTYRFGSDKPQVELPKTKNWFWGTLKQSGWIYGQVILAAILINILVLVSPLFIMNVYDRVVPNNAMETLWVLAIGALLAFTFDFILKVLRSYFIETAGKKADVILSSRIFDQLLDMKLGPYGKSSGAFANELNGYESLREFFTSSTLTTLVDLPFVFFFIGIIWLLGGPLALIPLLAIPLLFLGVLVIQYFLRGVIQKSYVEDKVRQGVLVETVSGIEIIKSVRADGRMRQMWEKSIGITSKYGKRVRLLSQLASYYSAFITQITSVAVVVYGAHLAEAGEITMGVIIAAVILSGRILAPLTQLANLGVKLDRSLLSLRGLNQIMAQPVERPDFRDFVHYPKLQGAITFENVSFAYPEQDPEQQQEVLKGVNVKINPGERVGIIGRVGSGKSTLAKLMLNLYSPTDGSVLIDHTDIRQIDPADLRRNIGFVPQDSFLFMGSIRENISISAPHAEDEDIVRAAVLAGVDSFVSKHPMGYDLPVGERGKNLSGGQRQAVTLARALLFNPAMLIMDEPTNDLDQQSEELLKKRLHETIKERTLILITHRYSLLSLVDRIIIVDNGQVIGDGPKKEILEALSNKQIKVV